MEIYKDLSSQASQEFEKLLNSQLSKANIEEGKKGRKFINISEIPYGLNKANLVSKIADLVRDKKIVGRPHTKPCLPSEKQTKLR